MLRPEDAGYYLIIEGYCREVPDYRIMKAVFSLPFNLAR
jgi:hypothetical protein